MPSMLLIRLPLLCALALALATTLTSAQTIYDVTKYGAVGDGKTDCSAAVQQAVNALLTSGADGSGTIYFPAATYLLSQPPQSMTQSYLTFSQTSWTTPYYMVAGEADSMYGTPLSTIIWNSDAGSLINYQGLLPMPIPTEYQVWLGIANLTITTPANIVGWRSMVEWDGVNVQVTNVNYVGNAISPQMLLFNSLNAESISLEAVTATNVNLFLQTFATGSTGTVYLWNCNVTNENYLVSQAASPSGIIFEGNIDQVTIQSSTFYSTNVYIEANSPTVSISDTTWYDASAALLIADSSNVRIDASAFIVTNNSSQAINGVGITLGIAPLPFATPTVIVADSQFTSSGALNSYTGVMQNSNGWTTISNNEFTGLTTGFNDTNSGASQSGNPFSLINNLFNQVGTSAVGSGSRLTVSGNTCEDSGAMKITCQGDCSIVQNSPACNA